MATAFDWVLIFSGQCQNFGIRRVITQADSLEVAFRAKRPNLLAIYDREDQPSKRTGSNWGLSHEVPVRVRRVWGDYIWSSPITPIHRQTQSSKATKGNSVPPNRVEDSQDGILSQESSPWTSRKADEHGVQRKRKPSYLLTRVFESLCRDLKTETTFPLMAGNFGVSSSTFSTTLPTCTDESDQHMEGSRRERTLPWFQQFEGNRKAGRKRTSRPQHGVGEKHRRASNPKASTAPHSQAPGLHPQTFQPPAQVTKRPRRKRDISAANLSADDLYGPRKVRSTMMNQRERKPNRYH